MPRYAVQSDFGYRKPLITRYKRFIYGMCAKKEKRIKLMSRLCIPGIPGIPGISDIPDISDIPTYLRSQDSNFKPESRIYR